MSMHPRNRRRQVPAAFLIAFAVALLALANPLAAQNRRIAVPRPAMTAVPRAGALPFDPRMTAAQLRALPPDASIALLSGRIVSARKLAATQEALQAVAARQRQLRAMDLRMSTPAGAPQIQWAGPGQLAQVVRMQPGTVVRLTDGRLLTAGDIGKLQALAVRTGLPDKLEARARQRASASLRGTPALVVRSADDLRKAERLPADAIVATEDGKRATAGDIRKAMALRAAQQPPALRMPGGVR